MLFLTKALIISGLQEASGGEQSSNPQFQQSADALPQGSRDSAVPSAIQV